ncbi:MAG: hypothetical protein K940chlam7_01842 [Chlamydiae bacterium]|nr:hypothetical protein [Chlamydiota bacterium]
MKTFIFLLPVLLLMGYVVANEEEYDIQEEECSEEADFCVPEEQGYSRHYRCRHRYSDYYYYADRDEDATWPGKQENSFIEELMRSNSDYKKITPRKPV